MSRCHDVAGPGKRGWWTTHPDRSDGTTYSSLALLRVILEGWNLQSLVKVAGWQLVVFYQSDLNVQEGWANCIGITSLYQRTSHHSCTSYHITSYIPLYDHLCPSEGHLFSYVRYLLSQLKALVTEQHLLCPFTHSPPLLRQKQNTTAALGPSFFPWRKFHGWRNEGWQLVSNAWSLWPTKDTDTSTTWTSPRSLPEMLILLSLNIYRFQLHNFHFTRLPESGKWKEVLKISPSSRLFVFASVLQQFHQTHVRVSNLSHTAAVVHRKEITPPFLS